MAALLLRSPTLDDCFRLRSYVASSELTYPHVGATRGDQPPPGYRWTRERVKIGTGQAAFDAASRAIRHWKMLPPQIAVVWPEQSDIRGGQEVIVRLRSLGFNALGPCRIVYTIDERTSDSARFGFAYGTLPGHLASGEERFLVEWTAADDAVWYELTAFSRPATWWAWLTLPLLRMAQRNFVRQSSAAMRQLITEQTESVADAA